jgi:signal transduction histidine kinase
MVRNAVAHGPATRILLSGRRIDHSITITVDDNGRGLPADEHNNVLGRFARGSTAAQGGSGLGLALVAQQAALHGGSIVLSDSPLGGLRATLTVSAADEPPWDSDDQD